LVLQEINKKIDILETSPIRQHLKNNKEISLFEEERVLFSDIHKIIEKSKENLFNPLKIVVLGEVKAGKSTLVNSLIGKEVSYTNVVEATASILEIKYSKEEKIIIDEKKQGKTNLNSLQELDNLINSNRNNQDFFNNINKISIFTNTERLKKITLVDTPGLNTVTTENEKRTESYIINSDVILWILNSHHLGQNDILEKIEEVMEYGKPIICVLNRIDEIDGQTTDLIEYVESEMGYMFSEIFATSAKKAWDGYMEKNISKVNESNINNLYEYLVNNIERNAEEVQKESVLKSINVQIMRDLYAHKSLKLRIDSMLVKFNADLKELNTFNNTLKEIISNKITEWIDLKFFDKEKQLMLDCGEEEQFINLAKEYSSEEYILNVINNQYKELNNYILDEWRNNREEFTKQQTLVELPMTATFNPNSIVRTEHIQNNNDIIESGKQGVITGGAVGLGLAGYAAWLGPAAAYVTIGSAMAAIVPPLFIAGAIGGVACKLGGKGKRKAKRYNQIDELVTSIKFGIRSDIMYKMENNLKRISDQYYDNAALMIMSIMEQCNTSKEELERINIELDRYIATVDGDYDL
jgi:small GTP-binding protein